MSDILSLVDLYRQGVTRMVCPHCGGGASRELSYVLWTDDDRQEVIGHCKRASCWKADHESTAGIDMYIVPKAFVPNPLRKAYKMREGFGGFGERCLVDDETVTVWQLYDLKGRRTGHVTRTADKQVRTYKEVPEPVYYWNGLQPYGSLWIFEDAKSAAVCSMPAVALLGTSLPQSLVDDIKALTGGKKVTVFVALDPGAEEAAERVHATLRGHGIDAVFVPMLKDFKGMTLDERDNLLDTYAR